MIKCITTLVSGNFQNYLPLFIKSIRYSIPDCAVVVFVKGRLSPHLKDRVGDAKIVEGVFPEFPEVPELMGGLRFLVDPKHFIGYEYVYFTDADFIFLPHQPDLFGYHESMMHSCRECYSGHRSSIHLKGQKRPFDKWTGEHSRMVGGMFMARKDWFTRTEKSRAQYLDRAKHGWFIYRESDEIMLYDICRLSGLKTPEKKDYFVNGLEFDWRYRDIHLGDFKFDHRWKNVKKMRKRWLPDHNVKEYLKLDRNKDWQDILCYCANFVPSIVNFKTHIEVRKKWL